ncbi:PrsW family intramembrane metalloprotease [Enemella evansiae]|uniref:zinc-ribbon domain-containing protein n=1 Tax=Enemella evansiae TaxID=2016499 RepID=UPI000B9759E1|nr:zinc-ribbon domain-containing protein [Enemella evansiae]OYN95926.1 PrsW family intramembrane metalloprotease [Enemella evansiae]
MECPRCRAELPEVAHFCHNCGQDMRSPDLARRKSFAVKPDEPVASFALVSTIMPRGAGERPQTYRLALTIALVAALIAAIFGALPIAVLIAAFAIPIVYIVYLYDVNLWEDEPVPVAAMAFLLTAVLGAGLLIGLRALGLLGPSTSGLGQTGQSVGPTVSGFLVAALLIPVVGELIRQIGPLVLASRPQFDDLMDGLTFGIISGVAFATADTLVRHWSSLTGGFVGVNDPGTWATLIFLEGFVKPLLMGTATGIACAEFSGLGEGYDGFSGRYLRGLLEAIAANIAYAGGIYLLGFLDNPTLRVMLQLIWALLILAVLVIRVRNVLHHGLMEAALEATARQGVGGLPGAGAQGDLDFCPRCEMPLIPGSLFCTACGTAVRTRSKAHKDRTAVAAQQPAPPATDPEERARNAFYDEEEGK